MEKTNNKKEVRAILKNLSISSRKVRLVVNLIREKTIENALNILSNTYKRSAPIVLKLIKSAISNATNNYKMNLSSLKIKSIFVNEGRRLKRIRPRAKGMAYPILKRSSHVTIILIEKQNEVINSGSINK